MKNPWDEIEKPKPNLVDPKHIVAEMFAPIYEKTDQLVNYRMENVECFPDEVMAESIHYRRNKRQYTKLFKFDLSEEILKEHIRYRLKLFPTGKPKITYELFSFKYPLLFYPIQFYMDIDRYGKVKEMFVDENGDIFIEDEADFLEFLSEM